MPGLLTSPSLATTLILRRLHRYTSFTTLHLLLHVWSMLDILVEFANVTGDFVPGFLDAVSEGSQVMFARDSYQGEWDERNKT